MSGESGKLGLVLEGGGMRGIFTAGVLDVFMEHGLTFDGLIGVSAGAIHGCSFVSGQHGRSIRYYKKYCGDDRFMGIKSLLRTGEIVNEKFCYHDIPERLDPYDYQAFKASPTKFFVTCSNVETGRPEYLQITDMKRQIDYIRASASLPFVSKVVKVDGMKLLDGGCTDSIPVRAFRRMGYRSNVLVLTQPADYVKQPEKKDLSWLVYWRYPAFRRAMKNRPQDYNHTLSYIRRLEKQGSVFVIRPEKDLGIGRLETDPQQIQRVYDLGRKEAIRSMEPLEEWLKERQKKEERS